MNSIKGSKLTTGATAYYVVQTYYMAPHLHHVPPSKSTTGVGVQPATIKSESTETAVQLFTGNGLDAVSVRVHLNSQIHTEDIEQFVRFGFDEQVKSLATRSGFQVAMVQDIYKHVSNFKRLKKVIRAMRASAIERAKAEIEAQEMEDLYASESDSEDDRGKNDGGKDKCINY
ncbi:uncharacterized protein EDB91DRAFT_1160482 [Suillus paluster]|uniref:uncharacterized protein n=1 Tax=Suillus paluster TaxID=48578 RepID=UPI001B886669|nr:uncharacterized protein EDB91DRAFT_1160482 [Suillus paluster]KAG1728992.1 hypothetical protein EDB91DRAFT_1160482 [Suillus paluster]